MKLTPDNWLEVFAPQTSLLELAARGVILYFGILVLMRFMPRRAGAELATMDLIFALLIAEAAAHSLGDYTSVADGIILIMIIMACNYLINMLSYRVPLIERLVSAPPLHHTQRRTFAAQYAARVSHGRGTDELPAATGHR